MRKILLLLLIIGYFQMEGFSQKGGNYSMYWNNISVYNPAETGVNYKQHINYLYRTQWYKLSGNPITHQIAYDTKLKAINSGIGVNYTYNVQGFETNQIANLNYAYHINFSEEKTLSVGISGGYLSKKIEANWIAPDGIIDPSIPINATQVKFNLNGGIYFKTDKLQVGIGAINIMQPTFDALNTQEKIILSNFTSYEVSVDDDFSLIPSIFLKTNLTSVQLDVNLLAVYKKTLWLGTGFRFSDAMNFMAGVDIKQKFRIGYAYDRTISQLQNYSYGSHEVILSFMLK